MIGILSQNGHITYNLKSYVIDEMADLDNLSIDDSFGSKAFCIENGLTYILNGSHEWVEKKDASSDSGSGSGTTDEPLTELEVKALLD